MPIREISAILVSWRDGDEAREAIASLALARRRVPPGGPRVSLVVVDNGGAVSRGDVLSLWPEASILVNDSNVGFGPAANQADSGRVAWKPLRTKLTKQRKLAIS